MPEFLFGSFRLIPSQHLLLESDKQVALGSRAMDILIALVERAGELVTKEELMTRVWPKIFVEPANLTVHISGLRRALQDRCNGNRFIINIPGRGYRFVAPILLRELSDSSSVDSKLMQEPDVRNLPPNIAHLETGGTLSKGSHIIVPDGRFFRMFAERILAEFLVKSSSTDESRLPKSVGQRQPVQKNRLARPCDYVALLLALYIAFWLGLDDPRWSFLTVFVVAQPDSGLVLAKSFYRILGTIAGLFVATALVFILPQYGELFLIAVAIWICFCSFAARAVRSFASYGFQLAGYTVAIVGIPAALQSHGAYTLVPVVNSIQLA